MAKITLKKLKESVNKPIGLIDDLEKRLASQGLKIVSATKDKKSILKGKPTQSYSVILSDGSKIDIRIYIKTKEIATIFFNDVEIIGSHQSVSSPKFKDNKLVEYVSSHIKSILSHSQKTQKSDVNMQNVKQMEAKEIKENKLIIENEIKELEKEIQELEKIKKERGL